MKLGERGDVINVWAAAFEPNIPDGLVAVVEKQRRCSIDVYLMTMGHILNAQMLQICCKVWACDYDTTDESVVCEELGFDTIRQPKSATIQVFHDDTVRDYIYGHLTRLGYAHNLKRKRKSSAMDTNNNDAPPEKRLCI